MTENEIRDLLLELNSHLAAKDIRGEICLYGGAAMCLAFKVRPATKDVDAVFHPSSYIRHAAEQIAQAKQLPKDWLNDAVKGFTVPHEKKVLMALSHLDVFVPEADYLLAMKSLSARVDTADREDLSFLIRHLQLKGPDEVFAVLKKYYPQQQIKPATQYFVEELFQA